MKKVKGYKGFENGFKCRDKQYTENTTFEEDIKPEPCHIGMHFCPMPLDVFNYYPPVIGNEYAEVESEGEVEEIEDKVSTNKLVIKSKISVFQLFKAHFDIIKESVVESTRTTTTAGDEAHANTAGYKAHANTAGDEAHANTAGYKAHANTAGSYAHANTAGDEAHANTAGYKAHANTAGSYAHANTAGSYAHANTAGDEAHANTAGYKAHANTAGYKAHANTAGSYAHANTAGDESIASSLGINSKSSAKKGWIVIVDWRQGNDYKWFIEEIYRAKVGVHSIQDVKIEPDTAYWFEDGKLKSIKLKS